VSLGTGETEWREVEDDQLGRGLHSKDHRDPIASTCLLSSTLPLLMINTWFL
jgi:hypothetical protein